MARKKGIEKDGVKTEMKTDIKTDKIKTGMMVNPISPSLVICRNKHWRYISSFHGPWLQLPLEVLEALAHSNALAARPQPMDAAVLCDVVAIRRLVDEAASLAVRAAGHTHTTSGRPGAHSLSRERRHRMRELAAGKLATAYRLDEIVASVATMQSASALDDVGRLVLQRNPAHADAQYVHFFHEKIPSRMMAQCTPLAALDALVADRPADPSPLRTRALTRLFTHDYLRSARDLTDALALARRRHPPLSADARPSSLEAQLLFHRAGVYLALACTHVPSVLDNLQGSPHSPQHTAEHRKHLRQNAKRALRDYTALLARFDYTPGLPHRDDAAHDYQSKLDHLLADSATPSPSPSSALTPYNPPPTDRPNLPPVFTLNQLFDAAPPPALPPYPPSPSSPHPHSTESVTYHPLLAEALHSVLLVHALLQTPAKELLRHAHNAARLLRLLDGYPIFLAARSPARCDWVEVLRRATNWIQLTSSWETLCRPVVSESGNANASASTSASTTGDMALTRMGKNPAPTPGPAQSETKQQRRDRHKHEAILDALADERVVDEESFQRAVRAREIRFREDGKAEDALALQRDMTPSPRLAITNTASDTDAASRADADAEARDTNTDTDTDTDRSRDRDTDRDYPIGTERAEAIARWVKDAPPLAAEKPCGPKKRRKKGVRVESVAGDAQVEVEGVVCGIARIGVGGGVV